MTTPEDRARAAATIDPRSLAEARGVVEVRCRIFLRRLELLEAGIEKVRTSGDVHRYSLALSMYLLASLPLKPEACPFCVQKGGGCRCEGCGYAETAEAVDDLAGRLHRLGTEEGGGAADPNDARERLRSSVEGSRGAAVRLLAEVAGADVAGLMEAKRGYIEAILDALPARIIGSGEVDGSLEGVREKLAGYW
ncbi:hypothetical protein [Candidatus Methanocrinis natronophilus]|uniref:DNA replication complex GINS family protein n=1 Tax=Candidatus Methanocrinis natronophilus TaxID=3033396 RepID=A0ABT5X6H4_9EURY|nr:hypothetical protein [Candidatus Methanocrinis natronophilus]MDF0590295.1 hypothetical protein [Candidatus Methanocrinis natronophilus]